MKPTDIRISDFDYELPAERIAAHPLPERDSSRLLVFRGSITQHTFRDIVEQLPAASLMIFNNSRVLPARLIFKKPTGAAIEVFCLEPAARYPDVTTALGQKKTVFWKCLVGRAGSWTHGTTLRKDIPSGELLAAISEKESDHFVIQLSWTSDDLTFAEVLQEVGAVPLPPYIRREAEDEDRHRYQTIYAGHPGSVAAPTAGLHFTRHVLDQLALRDIQKESVSLHVGAGTFKPVKAKAIGDHEMHAEFIEVHRSVIRRILDNQGETIAVGTTSLRTLESLYWIGVGIVNEGVTTDIRPLEQWAPYEAACNISTQAALIAIIEWMDYHKTDILVTKTSLLIVPGYQFRIVSVLITNFHQPRSTLLLLIAAFVGEKWKDIYDYALRNEFRFLSYGDSCLLFRQ